MPIPTEEKPNFLQLRILLDEIVENQASGAAWSDQKHLVYSLDDLLRDQELGNRTAMEARFHTTDWITREQIAKNDLEALDRLLD